MAAVRIQRLLPTPRGVAAAVFSAGALYVSTRGANNLLHLIADTVFATLIVGVAAPVLALRGMQVERELPTELFAGQARRGRYLLTGPLSWIGELELWEADGSATGGTGSARGSRAEASATWQPARRGWLTLDAVVVFTRAPFGLVEVWGEASLPARALAFPEPATGWDPALDTPRPIGLSEPDDLRAWREGDDWRDVHPLLSSRQLQPVVRTRAPAPETDAWIVVPDLPAEPFEAAIRTATGAVLDAWDQGLPRGLRVGAASLPWYPGPAWRARALELLALAEPTDVAAGGAR